MNYFYKGNRIMITAKAAGGAKEHMVAQVDDSVFMLIGLDSGNRFSSRTARCADRIRITSEQIDYMVGENHVWEIK